MAAKVKAKANAEAIETAKASVKKVVPAEKFTIAQLKANCLNLFGVSTSTFVGATYGMTGKYTIDEMKETLEAWGKKGVN